MLLATVVALALALPVSVPDADAAEVLAAVARHHQQVRDLQARFEQVYRSAVLGQEIVESGTVRFKRPGRMRWDYRTPEYKLFVSDGRDLYFYVPADRQVVVRARAGEQGIALRLLTGDADVAREFEARCETPRRVPTRLTLRPRRPDPDVAHVTIEVDAAARVQAIEIHDVQGNLSIFRFREIQENRGLRDAIFHFSVPRGVEVMRE